MGRCIHRHHFEPEAGQWLDIGIEIVGPRLKSMEDQDPFRGWMIPSVSDHTSPDRWYGQSFALIEDRRSRLTTLSEGGGKNHIG